jgi:hypothetical protein
MVENETAGKEDIVYKGEQTRFSDYSFGNLQTQNLEVSGDLLISGIAFGNPLDGDTIQIPEKVSVVIIQNTAPYTRLSVTMPLLPKYGKVVSIVSTVDIGNLTFTNALFGSQQPTTMKASVPLRFIFAGSWFSI